MKRLQDRITIMNIARLIFSLHHEERDIGLAGLHSFIEVTLSENESESSFGYNGRTATILSEKRNYDQNCTVQGLLANYMESSPRLEELFSLWNMSRFVSDPTFIAALMQAFAVTLHIITKSSDFSIECSNLVTRILQEKIKAIKDQLGSRNVGLVHATLGLLLTICRTSSHNCRKVYNCCIITCIPVLWTHIQKGKIVCWESPAGIKLQTDSRIMLVLLIIVFLHHADVNMADHLFRPSSLLRKISHTLQKMEPEIVALMLNGVKNAIYENRKCFISTNKIFFDSIFERLLLELYNHADPVVRQSVHGLMIDYCHLLCDGITLNGHSKSHGCVLHLLSKLKAPLSILHRELQSIILQRHPFFLRHCSALVSTNWEPCSTYKFICTITHLCQLVNAVDMISHFKNGYRTLIDDSSSEKIVFATEVMRLLIPVTFLKKDMASLLFSPNRLLQRMGLIYIVSVTQRIYSILHISGSSASLVIQMMHQVLPDLPTLMRLRFMYIEIMNSSNKLENKSNQKNVNEKMKQSEYRPVYLLTLLHKVVELYLSFANASAMGNFDALKLLDDLVPWPASYTSAQALENIYRGVDFGLLLSTLQLLRVATLYEKCFWLGTFAHAKKILNNFLTSADWNVEFLRGPLAKLLLIISGKNACHDLNHQHSFFEVIQVASDIFTLILQQTKLYTVGTYYDFEILQELNTLRECITFRRDSIFVVYALLNLSYHWMASTAIKVVDFVIDAFSSIADGKSAKLSSLLFNEHTCDGKQKRLLPFSPLLFCGLSICSNYFDVFRSHAPDTFREDASHEKVIARYTGSNAIKFRDSMRSTFWNFVTSILLHQTQRVRNRREYVALVSFVVTKMESQNANLLYSDIIREVVSNVGFGLFTPKVLVSTNLLTAVCAALNQINSPNIKLSYMKYCAQHIYQEFIKLKTKSVVLCQCFEFINCIHLSGVQMGDILEFLVVTVVDMIRMANAALNVDDIYSRTIFQSISLPHSIGKRCRQILCAAAAMNLRRLLLNPKLICSSIITNVLRDFASALSVQRKIWKDNGLFSLGLIVQTLRNSVTVMEKNRTRSNGNVTECTKKSTDLALDQFMFHTSFHSGLRIRVARNCVLSYEAFRGNSFDAGGAIIKKLSQLIIPSTLVLDDTLGDVLGALSSSLSSISSSQLILVDSDFEYLHLYLGLNNKSAIMATSLLSRFLTASCPNIFAAMVQDVSRRTLNETYPLWVLKHSLSQAYDGGWIQSWLALFEETLCESLDRLSIMLKNSNEYDKCDIHTHKLLMISHHLLTLQFPKQNVFFFEISDCTAQSVKKFVKFCIKFALFDFKILDALVSVSWNFATNENFFFCQNLKVCTGDDCFDPSILLQMIIGHSKFLFVLLGDDKNPIPNLEFLKILLCLVVLITHNLPAQPFEEEKSPGSLSLELNVLVDSILICYTGTLSCCDRVMFRILHLISRVGMCKSLVNLRAISLAVATPADPGKWISSVMSPCMVYPSFLQMLQFRHRDIAPQNIFLERQLGVKIFNSHIKYLNKLNAQVLLAGECKGGATRDHMDDFDASEIPNCRMNLEIEKTDDLSFQILSREEKSASSVDNLSNSSKVYDPCYWLPVIHHILHSWEVSIRQLIASGMLSFIILCLSSCSHLIRVYAVSSLERIRALLEMQGPINDELFKSRPLVQLVFNFLRNSYQRNELRFYVPPTMAAFLGKAVVQQPLNDFFGKITKYLLSKPFCDLKDVALYDICIARGDAVKNLNEKVATLRLLRDSFSSQRDHLNLCRKNAYQMFTLTFNVFANQIVMAHTILDVVDRTLSVCQSGRYMLERGVIFSWLKQQASPLSTFKLSLTRKVANGTQNYAPPAYLLAAPVRLASRSLSLLRRSFCSIILGGQRTEVYLKELHLAIQHLADDCIAICSSGKAVSLRHERFQHIVFLMWEISMAQIALNPKSRRNWTMSRLLGLITSHNEFSRTSQDCLCSLMLLMSLEESQDRYRHNLKDSSECSSSNEYALTMMMLAEVSQTALIDKPDRANSFDDDYQNKMLSFLCSLKSNISEHDKHVDQDFSIQFWNLCAEAKLDETLTVIKIGRNVMAITTLKGMLHATRGFFLNRNYDDYLMSQIVRWALLMRQCCLQEVRELFELSNSNTFTDPPHKLGFDMLSIILDTRSSTAPSPFFLEFQTNAKAIILISECILSQLSSSLMADLDTSENAYKCLDIVKEKLVQALRRVVWFISHRIIKPQSQILNPIYSGTNFVEQLCYLDILDVSIATLWDTYHCESVQIFRAAWDLFSIMVKVMDHKKGFKATFWDSITRSLVTDGNILDIISFSIAALEIALQITLSRSIDHKIIDDLPIIFGKQKITRRRNMCCPANNGYNNFMILWL